MLLCSLNTHSERKKTADVLDSVSIKHGLRTTDCGLGIKHGLGMKCGLWTEYKTRTMNYVRKVKLREMESGLA